MQRDCPSSMPLLLVCDMVSGFKGKRTFFQVWNNFTDAFCTSQQLPYETSTWENTFATLQKVHSFWNMINLAVKLRLTK